MKTFLVCITLCCILLLTGAFVTTAIQSEQKVSSDDMKAVRCDGRDHEPRAPVEVEAKLIKIGSKDNTAQAIVALVSVAERELEEVELSCDTPAGITIDTASGKWEKKVKLHKDVPKSIELEIDIAQPGIYDLFFKLRPTNPADPSLATEAYLRIVHGVKENLPEETENTLEWQGIQVEEGQP